ncbi:FtsX-like permease family protein [Enterococcus sp. BWB1-3]|uniref:ABC transporter permease n=1 Tax=Enterococcus sp. BWB1-3 TaxID=2787713 RepID=UPI00192190B9|nr:ABC transporter permease [Enterococcus sp. BWB1-3]MBL1230340.1 FtsX-like permease family protein [Enterococcus sp. BWB1-3]
MKKTALLKTSLREIRQTKTRFLSITGIIFLGVMLFVGLKATGPDMIDTADRYFSKQKLADGRIVSTLGLTEKDLEAVKKSEDVSEVLPRYTADVMISSENVAIKFIGKDLSAKDQLVDYVVTDGRMPEKSGEIALDSLAALTNSYKLNDTIELSDSDDPDNQLKVHEFKIVGFVQSPEYIEDISRGNTTVGKGTLDYFAVVSENDLDLSAYTEILFSFKGLEGKGTYSSSYEAARDNGIAELEKQTAARPEGRVEEICSEAAEELAAAEKQILDGENTLKEAEQKLKESKTDLDEGWSALEEAKAAFTSQISAGENELAENQATIDASEAELVSQRALLEQKKAELEAAAGQVIEGQNALNQLQSSRAELVSNWNLLQQKFEDYQGLTASITALQMIEDDYFASAVAQQSAEWIGILQQNQASAEIMAAVQQLINQPVKENLAVYVNTVNPVLLEIQNQQNQLNEGIQTIDAQATQIQQQIAEYNAGQQQIISAESQLQQGAAQLADSKSQLAAGWAQLEQSRAEGQAQLNASRQQLTEAEAAYNEGQAEFEKQKKEKEPELAAAKKELNEKKQELADLKEPTYYYFTRDDNPGYKEYKENANRISSLAVVFPIFFFLIAALVSLTTMTRMVEEKRTEIGSLKAIGYKNSEIAFKFLLYGITASLCGTVLGLAVGYYLFPVIIFNAYGQLYNIPNFITPWYLDYSLIAVVVAVLCTVGASLVVLRIDLFSTPAVLLRPKSPKAGKRILLERLTPVWKRMSFIGKVTARNLFRYKQRMLMTVLGIAGCMSLIITGFGLRDSISEIVVIQFNKIWHYQAVVTASDNETDDEYKEYQAELDRIDGLKSVMSLHAEIFETTDEAKAVQNVSVYVPEKPDEISSFITFINRRTSEEYKLADDGVIINEKLSKLFGYKVNDELVLKDSDNQEYTFKIKGIAENYTGHFVYMTPDYYKKVIGEAPVYRTDFLLFDKKPTTKVETDTAEILMENPGILNISFLSSSSDSLSDTISSLNVVVWVLIVVSGLLAFIVLYNLTNINVSERIRELSTIKVLGFYDNEVTMYVYRENIILTIIGILFGTALGKIVHRYVLETVEVDMLMFSPTIHWISYVYSALITLFFTFFVMILMHRKLEKVDMIDALKLNE